jgi:hypothetical protein
VIKIAGICKLPVSLGNPQRNSPENLVADSDNLRSLVQSLLKFYNATTEILESL